MLVQQMVRPGMQPSQVISRAREQRNGRHGEVQDAAWIDVQTPQDELAVRALATELGTGEAAAIILAHELQAALLLIDEIRGRRIAQQLGLQVHGALGILARAGREEGRSRAFERPQSSTDPATMMAEMDGNSVS